ncbi:primase C-terminal domain-containing protein [Lacticaseibacillus pabuli]|uniref:Primase C-terminal domain-containing protein n=1 Tax=Lacticaseibacillus pabuli TaxID=3025672 RepID=A0ABY7WPE2_9LACO|nr:primase C-terminal domain-containing protein [Lacticaseibacillus sp. KACC 23028]WDF82053.1 primase C-terminal domain-containing protein [Lacticaseibacillus sp. KACC 23028]
MPTLYFGHAKTKAPMREVDIPDDYLHFFANNYRPLRLKAATSDADKKTKKDTLLWGALGGKMIPNSVHGNTNTLGRDLLPLDFDNIADEGEFLKSIHDNLDSRFGYVLYKTFSYAPDNVRYRLLIPLDRLVTRENEFKALMTVIAKTLGVELDPASTTWGQLFFLPTLTESNENDFMIVHTGDSLFVNAWIEQILKKTDLLDVKKQLLTVKSAYQAPKFKTPLGFALDHIVEGQASNEDYLKMQRRLWYSKLSSAEIYPWYEYFNTLQPKPLKFEQMNAREYDRGEKPKWGLMFMALINGTDEHDNSTGNARNGYMFNFVAFLLDQQVKMETLIRLVEDLNERNRPPLSSNELNGIVNSALRRKRGE